VTASKPGRIGPWGRIVGPNPSRGERAMTIGGMAAGVVLAIATARASGPLFWSWWQWLLVLAVAADLGGGLIANALPATKAWYHRSGTRDWRRFAFAAIHLHLPLLALAMPGTLPPQIGWLAYAWLVGGAATVIAMPPRLRLAASFALTAIGTVLIARLWPITGAIGWMPLILFLKILAGHLIGPDRD